MQLGRAATLVPSEQRPRPEQPIRQLRLSQRSPVYPGSHSHTAPRVAGLAASPPLLVGLALAFPGTGHQLLPLLLELAVSAVLHRPCPEHTGPPTPPSSTW